MKKVKIFALITCFAVIGGCSSSPDTPSTSLSIYEKTSITTIADTSIELLPDEIEATPAITPGIWWSVSSDWEEADKYYYFNGADEGCLIYQLSGGTEEYTYSIEDINSKHDMFISAPFETNGDNVIVLHFDDSHYETLTYQGNITPSEFNFYSNDKLIELGKKYYLQYHEELPPYVDAEIWQDGSIALHFYYIGESNTATIEWYIVDRFTAKGKDLFENDIDLTEVL